ncbi:hypothetical protein M472_21695 [Sphingobacterium paucimobilis HER1398]|uniref:Uncharacterized protein n=2 Tax=Sphingobacterium TaxID=28453 RepID=U2JFB7_9SPHI|nr:hypothetical protein M472_21695 [Sphingobacterium paucimobilis HER1398]
MANAKTIAHKKHSSDSGAPEEVFLLNEVDRIPGKYYPEVDDYKDKYRYRHMDPTDKKTPKRRPLRSFPKKEVYKCFGWQLHPYDIEKLASYIIANPRLSLVVGQSALEGAAEADILVLTSGSGKYHMDSFLADLDTSNKLIIIASVRDIESVQQDIKHRIDAHFNKLLPFSQSDFDKLIDRVIEEAFVKQSAPQPEDEVVGMLKK